MAEKITLPNKTVEAIYRAVVALSRRVLPDGKSDAKIAQLRRFFAPLAEPIDEARQKKLIENSTLVAEESQVLNMAAIARSNMEIANAPCEFIKPMVRITEADLPKELKGIPTEANPFAGAANRQAMGEIMANLDFLFELPAVPVEEADATE